MMNKQDKLAEITKIFSERYPNTEVKDIYEVAPPHLFNYRERFTIELANGDVIEWLPDTDIIRKFAIGDIVKVTRTVGVIDDVTSTGIVINISHREQGYAEYNILLTNGDLIRATSDKIKKVGGGIDLFTAFLSKVREAPRNGRLDG